MGRNHDKGREAENAVADFMGAHGFPYAERRTKRGGHEVIGGQRVHRDAGDITGVPGVVVQVKWSPYMPLAEMLLATDRQRVAGRADVGLLVVKRKAVGLARAGEWDAYLPMWAVGRLLKAGRPIASTGTVQMSLATACGLLVADYGSVEAFA